MSSPELRRVDQLFQLERVIKMRMASAEQALDKELGKLREIEREIDDRQAKVDALKQEMLTVQTFLSGDKPDGDHLAASDYTLGLERRHWIDYDSQRETYYLELTHEEHREQSIVVKEARRRYKSLECKYDILHKKLCHSKQKYEVRKAVQHDAEIQDSRTQRSIATGQIS